MNTRSYDKLIEVIQGRQAATQYWLQLYSQPSGVKLKQCSSKL
ncbi:hypothetical protein MNBD_GAMMA12-2738 [hydrothermal vent metagenome]|uniref:Uncharacterized protein n=1 Tax=hydrothermal vent metagenome TaxID=652676 RepID=A0A3B0YIM1_9ZZZZ